MLSLACDFINANMRRMQMTKGKDMGKGVLIKSHGHRQLDSLATAVSDEIDSLYKGETSNGLSQ